MMFIPSTASGIIDPECKSASINITGEGGKCKTEAVFYSVLLRAFNNEAGMIRLGAICCCRQHTEHLHQIGLRLHFLHLAFTCTFFTTLLEFGILSSDAVQENLL